MLTRNRSFLASALCRPTLLRANVNLFDIQRGVPPALLSFNLARQSLRQSCEVRISSGGRRWAKCVIRVDGLHSQMDLSRTWRRFTFSGVHLWYTKRGGSCCYAVRLGRIL